MKTPLTLIITGFALAACQKPDTSAIDYKQSLQTACEAVTLAYAVFEATSSDRVKPDVLAKIRGAYAGVSTVCANPPDNSLEALTAAVSAVQAFKQQVAAAKS